MLVSIFEAASIGVIAALIALVCIIVFAGVMGRFKPDWFILGLLWIVGVTPAVMKALSPRQLSLEQGIEELVLSTTSGSAASVWVSRFATLAVLGCSAGALFWAMGRRSKLPAIGTAMLLGFLGYFVFSKVAPAFLSTFPTFPYANVYAPIVVSAVCCLPIANPDRLGVHAKWILAVYVYGSIALAVVEPGWSFQRGYQGVLPFVHVRLVGLGEYANTLGPLAAAFLLLELLLPSPVMLRLINLGTGAGVLLLTQSKTAWVAFALLALMIVILALHRRAASLKEDEKRGVRMVISAAAIVSIFAGLCILLAALASWDWLSRDYPQFVTLTGRTTIWDITLAMWQKNPLFGYGLDLWGLEFRRQHGMLAIGHAHNQFLQTLGEAGLVGLASLFVYLTILLISTIKLYGYTRGVPLVLLGLLLLRSVSEAPLRAGGIMDPDMFLQLVVIAMLVASANRMTIEKRKCVAIAARPGYRDAGAAQPT